MNIAYIYHSGFVVELEETILIFDYYKGKLPKINKDKKMFVFASHKHPDHFNPEIFQWMELYPQITYILSKDIKIKPDFPYPVHSIKSNDSLTLEGMVIETLRSTDMGVAFLVTCEGSTIYHAGDLNWWHWSGESNQYNTNMKANFLKEMNKIEGRHIDLAFLPLDPRQEEAYYWGFDYFMTHTDTTVVYPMHCWDDYSIIEQLKQNPCAAAYSNKIIDIG